MRCVSLALVSILCWQPLAAQVSLTPSTADFGPHPANNGPFTAGITVTNENASFVWPDALGYQFGCNGAGVTIAGVQPGSFSLSYQESIEVLVSYFTGASSGSFQCSVSATNPPNGDAADGFYNVIVTVPPPPPPPPPPPNPAISLTPHNPGSLRGGFDVVFAHSTPAYFSLGQARGVTLAYNSATVRPTPVIFVDVSNPPGYSPTAYSVELRRDNTLLKLLNDTTFVFYTPATTDTLRLAVALDAQVNGLSTGWHNVTVTVTSHLASGNQSNTVSTRILVVDQSASPFGKGVDLVGVQRLYMMPGNYAALVTEGDGAAVFFDRSCDCSAFTSPVGESSSLSRWTDPTFGTIYRRQFLDGSIVEFRNDGRILRSAGRFGDTTRFTWTDTLLTEIRDPMGKSLTLGYVGGKLQTVSDPAGRVTTYLINGSGQLYRITDPDNVATNLTYDVTNLVTSVTDRGAALTTFTYDALRRADTTYAPAIQIYTGSTVRPRTIVTAPERVVWQPSLPGTSAANAKLAVRPDTLFAVAVGPNGGSLKTALDALGGPTKVVGPYGETTTITRDALGRPFVTTEPNGHVTRLSYMPGSAAKYLLREVKDSTTGRTVTYDYVNYPGFPLRYVTGDVTRQDFVYHTGENGPVGALDSVLGENRAILYSVHRPDALGRDTLISDGGFRNTRISYDATWGNVHEYRSPDGGVTRYHYDAAGRVDSAWTPKSGLFTYQYDALNRRTQLKNPLGYVTQYVYGPTTLSRLVDPKGQVYKFAYNALGLLTARHDLADTLKADSLFYDEAGNARTARTRRGDVIMMTYDLLGRLVSRSGPDFPVDSFKYDPAARWMVAWNANQRDSSAFDQAGRLAATRQAMLGGVAYQLSYVYDIRNRLRTRTAPTGGNQLKLVYNSPGGGLDTLCAAAACVAFRRSGQAPLVDTVTYNPGLGGSWTRLQFHDSSTHAVRRDTFTVVGLDTLFGGRWWYDSTSRLTNEDASAAGTRKWRYYDYDPLGRLVDACDRPEGTLNCTNEYGGLSGSPYWGAHPDPYAYDASGNRIDSAASVVVGAGNRVLGFRGYTVGYDDNGSVVSKTGNGVSYTYTWDALGRLIEVRNGGVLIASYKYDAFGRRVAGTAPDATTERYVYDREHVAMDVNGAHAVKTEYGYQPGVDRLFAIRRAQAPVWTGIVLTDPVVGTVRGIANLSGGALRKKYEHTAWGQVSADTGAVTRYRMSGREYDQAARLYYMRARYYDPELGRFLSEDPLGPTDGLSLYAYAGNDPVNLADPHGLEVVRIQGCLFNIVESEVTVGGATYTETAVYFMYCLGTGLDDNAGPGGGWTPAGDPASALALWEQMGGIPGGSGGVLAGLLPKVFPVPDARACFTASLQLADLFPFALLPKVGPALNIVVEVASVAALASDIAHSQASPHQKALASAVGGAQIFTVVSGSFPQTAPVTSIAEVLLLSTSTAALTGSPDFIREFEKACGFAK